MKVTRPPAHYKSVLPSSHSTNSLHKHQVQQQYDSNKKNLNQSSTISLSQSSLQFPPSVQSSLGVYCNNQPNSRSYKQMFLQKLVSSSSTASNQKQSNLHQINQEKQISRCASSTRLHNRENKRGKLPNFSHSNSQSNLFGGLSEIQPTTTNNNVIQQQNISGRTSATTLQHHQKIQKIGNYKNCTSKHSTPCHQNILQQSNSQKCFEQMSDFGDYSSYLQLQQQLSQTSKQQKALGRNQFLISPASYKQNYSTVMTSTASPKSQNRTRISSNNNSINRSNKRQYRKKDKLVFRGNSQRSPTNHNSSLSPKEQITHLGWSRYENRQNNQNNQNPSHHHQKQYKHSPPQRDTQSASQLVQRNQFRLAQGIYLLNLIMKGWKSLKFNISMPIKRLHIQEQLESPQKYIPVPYQQQNNVRQKQSTKTISSSQANCSKLSSNLVFSGNEYNNHQSQPRGHSSGTPSFNLSSSKLHNNREQFEGDAYSINISAPSQNTQVPLTGRTNRQNHNRRHSNQQQSQQQQQQQYTNTSQFTNDQNSLYTCYNQIQLDTEEGQQEQYRLQQQYQQQQQQQQQQQYINSAEYRQQMLDKFVNEELGDMDLNASDYISNQQLVDGQQQQLQQKGVSGYILEDKITQIINSQDEEESRLQQCQPQKINRISAPQHAEHGLSCIKNNIQQINLMLGFMKLKTFLDKYNSKLQSSSFTAVKTFSHYTLYTSQLNQHRAEAASNSAQMFFQLQRLHRQNQHYTQAAKLSALVRLTRVIASIHHRGLKQIFQLLKSNINKKLNAKRLATKAFVDIIFKNKHNITSRYFFHWRMLTNQLQSYHITKNNYFVQFLNSFIKRATRRCFLQAFHNLKNYNMRKTSGAIKMAKFYTQYTRSWNLRRVISKWMWYVREMKISFSLKSEFNQVKRRDILMRRLLQQKVYKNKECLRGVARKWRLQIIKSNKVYQNKKKVMLQNKQEVMKKILKKVRSANVRVMRDAWGRIREDIIGDENTDIWREQKVKLRVWRGIREVYQRIRERKLRSIGRLVGVYRRSVMIRQRQVVEQWRKQGFGEKGLLYKGSRVLGIVRMFSVKRVYSQFLAWKMDSIKQRESLRVQRLGLRIMLRMVKKCNVFKLQAAFNLFKQITQHSKSKLLAKKQSIYHIFTTLKKATNSSKLRYLFILKSHSTETNFYNKRQVLRSQNDILDNQLNQKQYETKLYFNIILNNFKQILLQKFPQFDYSKKGRINRIQLALLLRQALNCSPLHYISDTQLLHAIHSTFNLYFGSVNNRQRDNTKKSPILIQQQSLVVPSSPIFDKKLPSDGHSISLSECISMKHLAQHKLNAFLQEIIQKPYPKSSSSVSLGTDQSCSSGSYYFPYSAQFNSFQTPRSFAVEAKGGNNASLSTPRQMNVQQQQVESIAGGLNRLSQKISIIDKKFSEYDIYKDQSLGLEAVILFMRSYIFPELSDYILYQMLESFIYDRKNRQSQSKSSYSPKFTALKKDQIVRLVVDNINEQQSNNNIELTQQTYDEESQLRSYCQEEGQSNKERPLTMCDIQGGTMSQNMGSPNQLSFFPQSQGQINQEGSSVATFKNPSLSYNNTSNNNNNEQTMSRRSLFKINRANIQQNLKKFSKRNNQPLGNKFLQKIQSKLPKNQFLGTNETFSNQNYCHNKEQIEIQDSKDQQVDQNNTSAILQQRVMQMQNHISQVKQQTTKLKQQLEQKLTPKVERQFKQNEGIMIPKDLFTSLINANQKSIKKPGSSKKKKKSRGASLSNNNNIIPMKTQNLKNSASQNKLPSGHLMATQIEPVYMTKKGGGALIMKKRNGSFSPSSAYNNIHHANTNLDKFYVLQQSPDKIYRSPPHPFRSSSGRRLTRNSREDQLNYSTVEDISYQHYLNRPCKSRYCLVCRGKYF